MKKGVLRNFTEFTGKHLCQGLFFNKVARLKKETLAQMFSVNFMKFLRTTFLQNTSGRLLLTIITHLVVTNLSVKLFKGICLI